MQTWMLFGAAAFALLVLACAALAVVRRPSLAATGVGLINLLIAGFNSAAPFRGALDPQYVGYQYGMLSASRGLMVSVVAGSVFIAAALVSVIAVSFPRGKPLLTVAIIDSLFALNMCAALVQESLTTRDFAIQFGEFLTIPTTLGFLIQLAVFVLPLFGSVWWAVSRSKLLPERAV